MSAPKFRQIWSLLAVIAVGTTFVALLATEQTKANSVGCNLNTDCGCSSETASCDSAGEPGYCTADNVTPGECVCNSGSGYGGVYCCPGNGCSNNGFCTLGGACICDTGWTGVDCATDINGCDPNPCDSNAVCTDVPAPGTGANCTCNPGYTGDGFTCTDINGCAGDPCNARGDTGAQCQDVPAPGDGNTCLCSSGWEPQPGCAPIAGGPLTGCLSVGGPTTCVDINECATANGGCAQVCTNTPGSFTCSCNPGYQLNGDGHSCDDIDECATGNGGCAQTCTNTPGGFTCSCGPGYTLNADGHTCDDINGCLGNPCDDRGDTGAQCQDVVAPGDGNTCTCSSGWQPYSGSCNPLPGIHPGGCGVGGITTCVDIDECATANGGCAQVCNNTPGSFTCSCNSGYQLNADGHSCDDINGCDPNPCDPNASCTDVPAPGTGANCTCNPGYTGDGLTCTPVGPEHFQAYDVDKGPSTKLPTKPVVDLVDPLIGSQGDVKVDDRPDFLFTPVNKNGEGLIDSADHLACYKIAGLKANQPVAISNQFGPQTLALKDGKLLCVPSAASLTATAPTPPTNPGVEHFECYQVDKGKSTKLPTKPTVSLVDEVGSLTNVAVPDRPDFLCDPVDKNGEGIIDTAHYLACYAIKGYRANRTVMIANQFGGQTLKLKDGKLLCVPSTVVP